MTRALVLALVAFSLPAFAQSDDDLLAPLPGAAAKKKVAKPKPKPKVAPSTKPGKPGAKDPIADELVPLAPSKGELLVKLAVPNRRAKLTIDDLDEQGAPWAPRSLPVGEHQVTVKALGFAPWSKKVTVTANKTTEVAASLEPVAAVLLVSSDVPGAEVWLNGKSQGSAPVEVEAPVGTAEVAVRKEGYREAAQTLKVVAGKEYPLAVRLQPAAVAVASPTPPVESDRPLETSLTPVASTDVTPGVTDTVETSPPIYQRWWFWTGVAVVAAGIATASYFGVKGAQPSQGAQACASVGLPANCKLRCANFDCPDNMKSGLWSGGGLEGAGIIRF